LTVLREALALGRDHEALPWGAADGQWGRDAVVAALVRLRKHKAKTDRQMKNLESWLFFPHAIFIPSDQFIQIATTFIILWIDFSHYI